MTAPLTTDRIRMFYSTAVAWEARTDRPRLTVHYVTGGAA